MFKDTLPKYIKYIKKDYRINNCNTLRIGSYDDFRVTDDNTRKDPNEGMARGGVHIDHQKNLKGLFHEIKNSTFLNPFQLSNRYIFCVSEPPMKPKLMDEFECDSFYEIIEPLQYGKLLMNSLCEKLDEKGLLEKCKGIIRWSKIEYTDNERLYDYDASLAKQNMNSIDDEKILENELLYSKKKTRFRCQREWRISFIFYNKLGFIPPPTKDILIDVNDKIKKCCNFP